MNDIDNIMIIVAHPDDEVLGCGGTIARLAMEGCNVYTLILGEGVTSRSEERDRNKKRKELAGLKKELKNANKILGVKKVYTFEFPDNRFDTVPLLDIIKVIEKVKNDVNPDILFTHHHGDLNIDHQITFKAVMTAFRPLKSERAKKIYSFEVPSSTEWAMDFSKYFMPNYFVNIENTIKKKIKALKAYKGEIGDFPHPRSEKAVEILASSRGINVGVKYAEAFEVIRILEG